MDRLTAGLMWSLLATTTVAANAQGGALDCLVEPHVVIEVSSPVPGVIGSIGVEKSDFVEAGQPLAQLESAVWESAVGEARSRAEATAAIESAEVNLAFAERNKRRIEELFDQGVVSKHHMDEAQTELELAQADLKRAKENRRTARHELERAREQLRQRTIRSPIGGVVVARLKSPGEFVEVSPILQLAQLDPLKIRVIAPSSMFGTIRTGMQVEVSVESAGEPYLAEVSLVDRIVDGASGSFGVELELPNPDYNVPVGLRCQVDLATARELVDASDGSAVAAVNHEPSPAVLKASLHNAGKAEATAASSCLRLGPVSSPALAEQMTTVLTRLSVPFSEQRDTNNKPNGYLVLSPRQPTVEAAKVLMEELRLSGVDDVSALWKQPYAGRVSFGYFSKQSTASRHRDSLTARGIEAEVMPRMMTTTPVWFEVRDNGRLDGAVESVIQKAQPPIRVSKRACDGDGGDGGLNMQPALHASRDTGRGD